MNETMKPYEDKMKKTIQALNGELDTIRAGRANPSILDRVLVDYFGTPTPVQQMAAVSVSEARILVIQPWDKSTLGPIEKAIQKSDIGIHPTNDGNVIRVAFPQPTEERRKELCKQVSKICEESKVAIRAIRRDANETFKAQKKKSEISEDLQKTLEKQSQDLTDKYIKEIDQVGAAKEKDILEF